jgi:hypothetical protein
MTAPPMILPMVTGSRLAMKKLPQVRFVKLAAVLPASVRAGSAQKVAGAQLLMNSPMGMKYILAMLCSKPAATKAEMGG